MASRKEKRGQAAGGRRVLFHRCALMVTGFLVLVAVAVVSPMRAEAAFPSYNGLMSFPLIADPTGPEEFSWEMILGQEEVLTQIDERNAGVFWEDGTRAQLVVAPPAHDADGTTVPTSLRVSNGDVITLIVHHRDGNPAAGGAPFDYPVIDGSGWEGGFSTHIATGPKDETELREERERIEREKQPDMQSASCRVPRIKGLQLKPAKARVRRANCTIGKVSKRKGGSAKAGSVVAVFPKPGVVLGPGSRVNITLGN